MGYEVPSFTINLVAGADLSAKQYHAVKVDANGNMIAAGAGEVSVGILQDDPSTGQTGTVMVHGVTRAVYGATVAAGASLAADANGKLVAAVAGNAVIGIALQGGVAGQLGTVLLLPRTA